MNFTAETTYDGILEREFAVGDVPGVLWTPDTASADVPLVLLGHGGGRDKKAPAMTGRARILVDAGFAAACIDAPGHGDRPRTAHDEREIALMQKAMATGEPVGPIVVRYNGHLAEQAVPEWQATLDALQDVIHGPVGYFGLNMGTAIGVPLTAVDSRITAAAFGLFWPDNLVETARKITVPIEYTLQWDDEHIPREAGLALFDAFGSTVKSLHANTGRHKELPRFEADSAVRFFLRHLM
ncbi:alpha/beta hydrolase [Kutzneria sp. 744]|uniref:alpha/beta hydrolase n=1 Tax=Kutzneria sp. (strain 744) TaxID=345341 RepID=UPI0004ADF347|nr:alpha/beta hydrolase [Kutzneria sp. 744]